MRPRARVTIVLWLLPVVLALALAGCGHLGGVSAPWDRPAPPAGLALTDLHAVADLQDTFNQDAGKPRLIMLVSPT
jgi:hypothetical protein